MNAAVQLRPLEPHETVGSTDIKWADGVFGKTIALSHSGMMIPQHAHAYPHVSVLVRGSVRAWADGKLLGDFVAPVGITIVANVKHTFLTLSNDTIILCVHDIGIAEAVEITGEHQFSGIV